MVLGAPSKYNQDMCLKAHELLSRGKSLAAICREFKISRKTLYNWMDAHPEFREIIDIGMQAAQARWEDMGEDGVVGNCEKFSAPTWIFTMKNRFREDYAENKDTSNDKKAIIADLLDKLID